jgi:hypothetical protein
VVTDPDWVAKPESAVTLPENRTLPRPASTARILTALRVENFATQCPTPRVVRVQSVVSSTSVDVQSFVSVAINVTLNNACFGFAA